MNLMQQKLSVEFVKINGKKLRKQTHGSAFCNNSAVGENLVSH
jgi:hypothetical protein